MVPSGCPHSPPKVGLPFFSCATSACGRPALAGPSCWWRWTSRRSRSPSGTLARWPVPDRWCCAKPTLVDCGPRGAGRWSMPVPWAGSCRSLTPAGSRVDPPSVVRLGPGRRCGRSPTPVTPLMSIGPSPLTDRPPPRRHCWLGRSPALTAIRRRLAATDQTPRCLTRSETSRGISVIPTTRMTTTVDGTGRWSSTRSTSNHRPDPDGRPWQVRLPNGYRGVGKFIEPSRLNAGSPNG